MQTDMFVGTMYVNLHKRHIAAIALLKKNPNKQQGNLLMPICTMTLNSENI